MARTRTVLMSKADARSAAAVDVTPLVPVVARVAARSGVEAIPVRPASWRANRSGGGAVLAWRGGPHIRATAEALDLPDWRRECLVAHELGHVSQGLRSQIAGGAGFLAILAAFVAWLGATASRWYAGFATSTILPMSALIALLAVVVAVLALAALYAARRRWDERDADRFAIRIVGGSVYAAHMDAYAQQMPTVDRGLFDRLTAFHPTWVERATNARALDER